MKRRGIPKIEHAHTAREAGLRYVSDLGPGIRREARGKAFRYLDPDGRPMRDPATLERIRALAIPPAWTEVWICLLPRGHIQATGRDARRRKQYRYHADWHAARGDTKYARLVPFASALPRLRERVEHDLASPGLERDKVLATVVQLLELTLVRIGNDEYARANGSFGLTTMRDHHVDIAGHSLTFAFRGKSGKQHNVKIKDRRLARIVRTCQDLPGQELFQYVDDAGAVRGIDSADVNDYLREAMGAEFTAKHFRTWAGTLRTMMALSVLETPASVAAARRALTATIREVAAGLGNTPAVCRASYIHPAVIGTWQDGTLARDLAAAGTARGPRGLDPDERKTLAFLRRAEARAKRQPKVETALRRSLARRGRASQAASSA